jgi:hypothetical protein
MVQTLTSYRSDKELHVGILPQTIAAPSSAKVFVNTQSRIYPKHDRELNLQAVMLIQMGVERTACGDFRIPRQPDRLIKTGVARIGIPERRELIIHQPLQAV